MFEREGLLTQMIRYGISGLGLTAFYSLIYLLCIDLLAIQPLIANTLAFLCTAGLGYVVHSRWSFQGHGSREVPVLNGMKFLIVNLAGFAVNSFWVWLIVDRLHHSARLPLVPIALVTPWLSFWLNRRWTFG